MDYPSFAEIEAAYSYLTPEERREIDELIAEIEANQPIWEPTPGPQATAYYSQADILGYGGSGGGGKTDLLIGLAATAHTKAVIFRRVFPLLRDLIDRSREILNPGGVAHRQNSFNESLHRWTLSDDRRIEFEACQYERDKQKQRGRPRDFYGFDEVTEFTRSQVEFIIAWNRSTVPGQRCRVVMTFNPPSDEGGSWVLDYFKPWLAYLYPDKFTHPNPAAPGELRWYATVAGQETECESGEPFYHGDELIQPRSRTFIPAKLDDNPYLRDTGYRSVLQSLPEPMRSQLLHGDFSAQAEADPWQVIPTAWVRAAQERWLDMVRPAVPLTGAGVDVARGGRDKTTLARRYANWIDEVKVWPGIETPDGPTAAALISQEIEGEAGYINIDVIGVGSSVYDSLKMIFDRVIPINASAGTNARDKTGRFKLKNKRTEMHWLLREALDPHHGNDLALPPGPEVLADLCAARYRIVAGVIVVEEKEDIKARIGRSPDVGEALMLAHYESYESGLPIAHI